MIRTVNASSPLTYYGVLARRMIDNFAIGGLLAHPDATTASILIRRAEAEASAALGRLNLEIACPIGAAADEILAGLWHDQFVVDVCQAGVSTSDSMNANEVLANRAAKILGESWCTYTRVHHNVHVDMEQSTYGVPPTASRLTLLLLGAGPLVAAADTLAEQLRGKARELVAVLKTGRTLRVSTGRRESVRTLTERTIDGLAANAESARELLKRSTAVATALSPCVWYADTDNIAKESVQTRKSGRVLARDLPDPDRLDEILSVEAMTRAGVARS